MVLTTQTKPEKQILRGCRQETGGINCCPTRQGSFTNNQIPATPVIIPGNQGNTSVNIHLGPGITGNVISTHAAQSAAAHINCKYARGCLIQIYPIGCICRYTVIFQLNIAHHRCCIRINQDAILIS